MQVDIGTLLSGGGIASVMVAVILYISNKGVKKAQELDIGGDITVKLLGASESVVDLLTKQMEEQNKILKEALGRISELENEYKDVVKKYKKSEIENLKLIKRVEVLEHENKELKESA